MTNNPTDDSRPWSVFLIFLRLGLTSFGGPIAHLGYFRAEFVTRRRWLSERSYADLVALCRSCRGLQAAGRHSGRTVSGWIQRALAAWAGFTLPSAIALILFALGISSYGDYVSQGALHGLKVVAVAVVAQAVWGMARNLCTDGASHHHGNCYLRRFTCAVRVGTGWRDCYRRHRRPVIVQASESC
ncbi:chromate transporter [Klebsiella pneumoniae]|uniref:chromate transporter n=1 Tax=Klebsiella pneumoniae TaxID=573 RepID=UPI000F549611